MYEELKFNSHWGKIKRKTVIFVDMSLYRLWDKNIIKTYSVFPKRCDYLLSDFGDPVAELKCFINSLFVF